jgi:hypothetical protein
MDKQVHKRANLAGVHIDSSTSHEHVIDFALPVKLDQWSAAIICLKAVQTKQGLPSENEQWTFSEFVEYLKKLVDAANESQIKSDVNKRFVSSSAGRIVTSLASHSTVPGTEPPFGESPSITDPDLT